MPSPLLRSRAFTDEDYIRTTLPENADFVRGVRSTIDNLTASSYANAALSQELSQGADDPEYQRLRARADQLSQRAAIQAPRVRSLRDIDSFGDVADFVQGGLPQGAVSTVPALAGAALAKRVPFAQRLLGRLTPYAGAAVPAYQLERGEAALNQYQDPELAALPVEERDRAATGKGLANAALEAIVPGGLGKVVRNGKGYLRNIGTQALEEGLTETAQEAVGFGAEKYLAPDRELDPMDLADAAALGALGGGGLTATLGAPAALARAGRSRQEPPPAAGDAPVDVSQPDAPLPGPDTGPVDVSAPQEAENQPQTPVDEPIDVSKPLESLDQLDAIAQRVSTPEEYTDAVLGGVDDGLAQVALGDADPTILADAVPGSEEQALIERSEDNRSRTEQYAEMLLENENISSHVKDQVRGFQGDYSDPKRQQFIARHLAAARTSERLTAGADAIVGASGWLSKKSWKGIKFAAPHALEGLKVGLPLAATATKLTAKLGLQLGWLGAKAAAKGAAKAAPVVGKAAVASTKKGAELASKAKTPLQDAIIKRSEAEPASIDELQFEQLASSVYRGLNPAAAENPALREALPLITRSLVEFRVRTNDLSLQDLTAFSSGFVDGDLFVDPEVALTEVDNFLKRQAKDAWDNSLDPAEHLIERLRAVTTASQDAKDPASFLARNTSRPLPPQQLRKLGRLVDMYANSGSEEVIDGAVKRLAPILGGDARALRVLDYYRKQNESNFLRYAQEQEQGVDEGAEPKPEYHFADAQTKRFFIGDYSKASSGAQTNAAQKEAKRLRGVSPGADVKVVSARQYADSTEQDPEALLGEIRKDIESRITSSVVGLAKEFKIKNPTSSEARARVNELIAAGESSPNPKSTYIENIRKLVGQRLLIEQEGTNALELFQVVETSARDTAADLTASDADINAIWRDGKKYTPDSAKVAFRTVNGKRIVLSAISMQKHWGRRGESEHSGEGYVSRVRRLFNEAVSAILNRPDIAGVEGVSGVDAKAGHGRGESNTMPRVLLEENKDDPRANIYNYPQSLEPEMVAAITANRGNERKQKKYLDDLVKQYERAVDDGDTDLREAIETALQKRLDEEYSRLRDLKATMDKAEAHVQAIEQKLRMPKFAAARPALQRERAVARSAHKDAKKAYFAEYMPGYFEILESKRQAGKSEEKAKEEAKAESRAAQRAPSQALTTLLRDAMQAIRDIKYEEQRAIDDAEKSGVPESDPERFTNINQFADGREGGSDRYTEGTHASDIQQQLRAQGRLPAKKSEAARKPGPIIQDKVKAQQVADEIRRIRGDIEVSFATFKNGGSGQYNADLRKITIAWNARNAMGVGRHEALHDFFATLGTELGMRQAKADLLAAVNTPYVRAQLRGLLAKHKMGAKALQQIESDPEERLAYAYQFWAEGQLRLGKTGMAIFDRLWQFLKDITGIVSRGQRADLILEALHEGKFADMSVAQEVLADIKGDTLKNRLELLAPPVAKAFKKVVLAAPDRLRDFQDPGLNKIADLFANEDGAGFLQDRFRANGVWKNRLAKLLDGTTAKERRQALENLQAMKDPQPGLETELRKFLDRAHEYMVRSEVKRFDRKTKTWKPLGKVKGYFPRVFDRKAISRNKDEWMKALADAGVSADQQQKITDAILHGPGQLDLAESEHHLGFSPFAAAVEDRKLTFINENNAAVFAKFQKKEMLDILGGYIEQMVHRAEYSKAFGNTGEYIKEVIDNAKLSPADKAEAGTIVRGLEGSLGSEMSSSTKEVISSVIALENLILLPLAMFSQVIDPIVLAARSGDIKDAGRAYVTALRRLAKKVTNDPTLDTAEELATVLGIVNADSTLEAMGMSYGSSEMSDSVRRINREFFKWNGMQGWNDSMRIAATAAGERYLLAANDEQLQELGLSKDDIRKDKNGRLVVTAEQFAKYRRRGLKPTDADTASAERMARAMFQFVDQAVLRPSSAHRPVWMSDPRFQLVGHLKQFTFAMHNVVLKRMYREMGAGRPAPAGIMLLTIPMMLASGLAKSALTGSSFQNGWGIMEHMNYAVERSGLLGLGDFTTQATQGMDRGKMPGEELLGPAAEHLLTILRWIGGDSRTDAMDVVDRTIPLARYV